MINELSHAVVEMADITRNAFASDQILLSTRALRMLMEGWTLHLSGVDLHCIDSVRPEPDFADFDVSG